MLIADLLARRQRVSRRLIAGFQVLVLLVLATLAVTLNATTALATSPPGPCLISEDGDQQLTPDGLFWECRCIAGQSGVVCAWVVIEDDSEEGLANGLFVTAELGYVGDYYGMLRSRSDVIGPWQQFSIGGSGAGDGTWAIRSLANRLYVSSEFGQSGDLYGMNRARANVIAGWEKFFLYQLGPNTYTWESYEPVGVPCCYVSTELGYGGDAYAMLRSRSYSVGPWEQYAFFRLGSAPVGSGSAIANAKRIPCPTSVQAMTSESCQQLIPSDTTVPARK
jgi:hypothetical protein